MADLAREMDRLRAKVAPAWSDTRQKAIEKALLRRTEALERRRRRTQVLVVVAAAVVLGVLGRRIVSPLLGYPFAREAVSPSSSPPMLILADGSSVTPGAGSDVRWVEVGPKLVSASIKTGRARFDIAHQDGRIFRVEAGPVAVQVLGTTFVVERVDDRSSRVSVERGRVRIFWNDTSQDLTAGEAGVFPPPETAPLASAPPGPVLGTAAVAEPYATSPKPVAREAPSSTWRNLAQGGAFDEAYVALKREGGSVAVRDEVNDLLLAADVARLSHHPAEAVEPLRQILRLHANDPRASLAAFTVGRVLLESLGQPREAADAFAQARALSPAGELSADALAREVEARAAAGDMDAARALAEKYTRDFPTGARLRSVRRYGGLE